MSLHKWLHVPLYSHLFIYLVGTGKSNYLLRKNILRKEKVTKKAIEYVKDEAYNEINPLKEEITNLRYELKYTED